MARFLFCFMLLVSYKKTIAQSAQADSLSGSSALTNAVTLFHNSTGEHSAIYNGVRHEGYRFDIKGQAYFDSNQWQNGSLYYEGILYQDIPMLYDEVKDQVVVKYFETNSAVNLVSERISGFTLAGHSFKYLSPDNGLTSPGFYDVLYHGNLSLLMKRAKYIDERVNQLAIDRTFTTNYNYFLMKGGSYYLIKNMKSIFKVLEDKEKEIRQFIKANSLDFKADEEFTLTRIAAYYDQLSNHQ